jgi:hypothetical protein
MTQNEKNTPQTPVKPPLSKKLQQRLDDLLEEKGSILPTSVMAEQAMILDHAFRRAIHSATTHGLFDQNFVSALKAQNQYRLTVKALESYDSPKGGNKKT